VLVTTEFASSFGSSVRPDDNADARKLPPYLVSHRNRNLTIKSEISCCVVVLLIHGFSSWTYSSSVDTVVAHLWQPRSVATLRILLNFWCQNLIVVICSILLSAALVCFAFHLLIQLNDTIQYVISPRSQQVSYFLRLTTTTNNDDIHKDNGNGDPSPLLSRSCYSVCSCPHSGAEVGNVSTRTTNSWHQTYSHKTNHCAAHV